MIQVTPFIRSFTVTFSPLKELDWAGYLIHAAPESDFVNGDFTPSASTLINDGVESSFLYVIPDDKPGGIWGIKVCAYDTFGEDELNFSELITVNVPTLDMLDTVPPGVPHFTGYTTATEGNGVFQSAYITVNWALDSIPADFSNYIISVKKGSDTEWTETQLVTSTSHKISGLVNGAVYEFKIAAVDKWSNRSEWSSIYQATAATDTIPPAVPKDLEVTAAFKTVFIQWSPNLEYDFKEYWVDISSDPAFTEGDYSRFAVSTNTMTYNGTSGVTYYIRVSAVDYSTNVSDPCEAKTITPATIKTTDIADFALEASKVFTNVPVFGADPDTIWKANPGAFPLPAVGTNPETPAYGISWGRHEVFYQGQKFDIEPGATAKAYVWGDFSSNTTTTVGGEPLGNGQYTAYAWLKDAAGNVSSAGSSTVTVGATTNYYVATTGSDSNPGTIDKPWGSIQKALDTAIKPDDVVNIRGGNYTLTATLKLKSSGLLGHPITIQAYPGETVTITNNSAEWRLLATNGRHEYYHFIGLRFVTTTYPNPTTPVDYPYGNYGDHGDATIDMSNGVWDGAGTGDADSVGKAAGVGGFVFRNCYIHGKIYLYGHNCVIDNCTFEGRDPANAGSVVPLWTCAIQENYTPSHHNVFSNNTISNYSQRGIWSLQYCADTQYLYNTITNIGDMGIDSDGAGLPNYRMIARGNVLSNCKLKGIEYENTFNGIIEQNKVYGWAGTSSENGYGLHVINYGPADTKDNLMEYRWTDTNTVVRNNIISGGNRAGIICTSAPGTSILNNTIHGVTGVSGYYAAITLLDKSDSYAGTYAYCHNCIVKNNIVSNWSTYAFEWAEPSTGLTGTDFANNLYFGGSNTHHNRRTNAAYTLAAYKTAYNKEAGSLNGDPKYVNAAVLNFTLQSGSPAINAGATLTKVTNDYFGGTRSVHDIGACEYSATDTIAPVVTDFYLPLRSVTSTMPVVAFKGIDNTGITGYLITQSSTPPNAGDAGWSSTAPVNYTFAGPGQTFYANVYHDADVEPTNLTAGQFVVAKNRLGNLEIVWNAQANTVIGTAYIMDAAITNAKIADLAVDDAKIASLSGDKITAHTVTADKFAVGAVPFFNETWETEPVNGTFLTNWTTLLGSGEIAITSGGISGSKLLRVGNSSGDDERWFASTTLIPFDPTKIYRSRIKAQTTGATSGVFYAGFLGVAADGVTFVKATDGGNDFRWAHFHVASSRTLAVAPSWSDFEGYTKGFGASTGTYEEGTLRVPGKMHPNVRYLRPIFICNFPGAAGTVNIDSFYVDTIATTISGDQLVTGTIGAQVIGVGGDRLNLRGDTSQLTVNDGTRDRVVIGNVGTVGTPNYGIDVLNASGSSVFKVNNSGAVLQNLTGGSINANLVTINNLVVGNNVTMGPNAAISWSMITDPPPGVSLPSYITSTKITATTIESPTITAGSISGTTITGSTIQTGATGKRAAIYASDYADATLRGEIHVWDNLGAGVEEIASIGVNSNGSDYYVAMFGTTTTTASVTGGVAGVSYNAIGVYGRSVTGNGVYGYSQTNQGISGYSDAHYGVMGFSPYSGEGGVYGSHLGLGAGVYGNSVYGNGVTGVSQNGVGIKGTGYTWDFSASGGSANNYGTFTAGHDGLVSLDFTAEVGDIICDVSNFRKRNVSSTLNIVTLSSSPKQNTAVGVLTTIGDFESYTPACLDDLPPEELSEIKENHKRVTFNAVGEGQINICKDGGNIEAGDYICSSSRPGKGMKQDDDLLHNYTVAKAREDCTWAEGEDDIRMIACTYHCG